MELVDFLLMLVRLPWRFESVLYNPHKSFYLKYQQIHDLTPSRTSSDTTRGNSGLPAAAKNTDHNAGMMRINLPSGLFHRNSRIIVSHNGY